MNRRSFLRRTLGAGGALALGPSFWERAWAAPVAITHGPYGPLRGPDQNGLMLPEGFTSRVIGQALLPVEGTTQPWHLFPDGGACFEDPDTPGGWILVSNSEAPTSIDQIPKDLPILANSGGVTAVRFAPDGQIVSAYPILRNTRANCAGGITPWGTWLSCEEFDTGPGEPGSAGRVWECDPTGRQPAKWHPLLGSWKHEAAGVDPDHEMVFLTEDEEDGLFYRATPSSWPDLSDGLLEVAQLHDDGSVTWHEVPDPMAKQRETRYQVPEATRFDGGEGCFYDMGSVYVTTKGDDRVWRHDVEAETMEVFYDAKAQPKAPLRGVDNIIVSLASGDILVAEDGDNMEVVLITPDREMAPLFRATGGQHGSKEITDAIQDLLGSLDLPSPLNALEGLPLVSEITGLAFTPDGHRFYFNSQRGFGLGITYEVTGPFREAPRQPLPIPLPDPVDDIVDDVVPDTGVLSGSDQGTELADSGLDVPVGLMGLGALGAAMLAWRARGALGDGPDLAPPPTEG